MWRMASGRLAAAAAARRSALASRWALSGCNSECGARMQIASISGLAPTRVLRSVGKIMDDEDLELATGLEREEAEYKRQGKSRFDIDPPRGPFGTEDAPAMIQSIYDERIVGCPGGPGEDEHDVVWFRLKKGKRHVCRVCGQVFELEVVGPGGPPGGHHD